MPVAPPVMPEYPALPLLLSVIEMEVDVDRARLIAADEPGGDALPAVVVRMPAYVAGALAKVLDTWAIVCQAAGSDDTTEWVTAAHALLLAGREAADGIPYPELSDLRHSIPDTLTAFPATDDDAPGPGASVPAPAIPVPSAAVPPTPVPSAPVPAAPMPSASGPSASGPSSSGVPAEPPAVLARGDDHRVAARPLGQRAPAVAEPAAAGRRGDGRRVARVPAGARGAAAVTEPRSAAGSVEGRRVGGLTKPHTAGDGARSPATGTLVDGRRAGDECA
ncbi:hypothetical protein BL253_26995 [Pseudofrankia asymbiotica]|uniref:Uncharacterized protein n=2 Tax=Pseudofrankia asymbiotica TaxID=1834516 RepID=A0A1V2I4B2_9ACTN|nr:hypothetical protein BL253_26995 [Pseudofrankia asymbiotica]